MRGSVRLSALSGLHVIDVWTHDSVGLGEDGPTHQPVEHYAALRAMPNFWFVRPGDANETAAAWRLAVERRDGPVASRSPGRSCRSCRARPRGPPTASGTAPTCSPTPSDADGPHAEPDVILLATGSELQLAMAARDVLTRRGDPRPASSRCPAGSASRRSRPNTATRSFRRPARKRVSVEAGVSLGWDRWVGPEGAMIAIERFGTSAPAEDIFKAFGFTPEHVADVAPACSPARSRGVISPQTGHRGKPTFG